MEELVPIETLKKTIKLVKINNPLNPMINRESKLLDYNGESLLTIKDNYFPKNLPVIASLNGKIIADHDLGYVKLQDGDYLVFYPTIEGGGGNGMMRSIAFLALAIMSIIISPMIAGPIAASMGIAAGTPAMAMLTGMIGMGINVLGGMLLNALLPPVTPDQDTGGKKSNTYSFGATSTQAQGIPIPRLYGVLKSHGNIITAFNYNVKEKSTANVLICLSMGPVEAIYDYKINDQRQGSNKDVEIETRHGEIHQEVITNFNDTKVENPYSVRIKNIKEWQKDTDYEIDKEVIVGDYKFIAVRKGRSGETFPTDPSGSYVIGSNYTETPMDPSLYTGVIWTCESDYPYKTTTIGNDFDALEIEFNFPKGLAAFTDEGEAGANSVSYDIQISPEGTNDWMSVTRKAKGMSEWRRETAMPYGTIIGKDGFLYRVTYPYQIDEYDTLITLRSGNVSPNFPKRPYAVAVECLNDGYKPFEEAYLYSPSAGTYTNVKDQLEGNILNNGLSLALNESGSYLYVKWDSTSEERTNGFGLLYHVVSKASSNVSLRAQYIKRNGDWNAMNNTNPPDLQDEHTISPVSRDGTRHTTYTVPGRNNKANRWIATSSPISGYGSYGHWARFYFNNATSVTTAPKMGLFLPYEPSIEPTRSFIVYVNTLKNYDSGYESPDNGYWSAGYFISSGGLLTQERVWVEIKNNNDYLFTAHTGEAYKESTLNALISGSKWRYITGDIYYIPKESMESGKKITKATTKPFYHVVRTPDIYPHGSYDIKIEKTSSEGPDSNSKVISEMYLTNIREIAYDDFSYPRQAIVGVKALATEKLSGSVDFSAITKGMIVRVNRPDEVLGTNGFNYRCILDHVATLSVTKPITGTDWETYWEQEGSSAVCNNISWESTVSYKSSYRWVTEYSNNPAWVCYDIISQPVISMPSEVYASDGNYYECVISHTSSASTEPGTGTDYSRYWSLAGDVGVKDTWALGNAYTARGITRYEGIDASRIDLSSFKTWADYCDELVYDEAGNYERRHEFNGIFDSEMTLWEAALKVGEMSRTSLLWNGISLAAVTDKLITLPTDAVQLFSSGNVIPDSFQESFLSIDERVGEIEINFLNRDKDWEKDTISIYDPDFSRPSNKTSIQPYGITKSSQAWRHARYLINCNKLLKRTIQFETDLEAIACTIGDVFYFHNDVPRWGLAGGRVVSCSDDGSYLELDQNITMTSTSSYGVMVRLNDDTLVTKDVDNLVSDTELVTNRSFESVYTGWTLWQCTAAIIPGGKIGNCIELTQGTGTDCGIQTNSSATYFPTTVGKKYRASVWIKSGTSGNEGSRLRYHNVDWSHTGISDKTTSSDWTQNTIEWTAEDTRYYLFIYKLTATAGTMLFDEVSVREVLDDTGGESAVIAVTVPFTDLPQQYDPYSFGIADSEAKAFRVVNISQSSEQRAKITAIEYDADVYADDLEESLVDEGDDWQEIVPIKPVTNLVLREVLVPSFGTVGTGRSNVEISFSKPEDCVSYRMARVWYKIDPLMTPEDDSPDDWTLLTETSGTSATLYDVSPLNRYIFCVTSVSKDNVESLWEESPVASIVPYGGVVIPRSRILDNTRVSGISIVGNPNSATFTGKDCKIEWNPITIDYNTPVAGGVYITPSLSSHGVALSTANTDTTTIEGFEALSYDNSVLDQVGESGALKGAGVNVAQSSFKDYEIKVCKTDGTLLRTEYVSDPYYIYTYEKNFEDTSGVPQRSYEIRISARDVNLNTSPYNSISVHNEVPAAPSITVSRYRNGVIVDINPSYDYLNNIISDTDVAGYEVYAAITTTNLGSSLISSQYLKNRGPDTHVFIESSSIGSAYVAVGAYDVYEIF